ncbi:hypothetical protein Tco_0047220 [Tanacetum coccineum]
METYATFSEETKKWIDAEAKAVQIILTRIDNDIYSIVDACPNAMEIWKAIERFYKMMNELVRNKCEVTNHQVNVQFLLQLRPEWQRSQAATRNKGKAIVNSPPPTYDSEPKVVADDEASLKETEIDKLIALISMSFKKIYKPTNNNLRNSSNTRNMNVDNTLRSDRRTRDDTDDEPKDQELEAHYMYMAKIQKRQHPDQPKSANDTYLVDQGDTNSTLDSSNMSNNRGEAGQDDQMLQQERELLASLIEQMKIEIDGSKQNNKSLESSNKALREAIMFLNNELKRYKESDFMKNVKLKCAKAYGLHEEQKVTSTKSFRVIATTSVSRPQLKSSQLKDMVMQNNSQVKTKEVEDHHRNFMFSNNKMSVTACNDSLNAKTSNVNFVCGTCGKCVFNANHDSCVLNYINDVNSRTKNPIVVPIRTREPKRTVNQSVATPHKKTIASETTIQRPRNTFRRLYEHVRSAL